MYTEGALKAQENADFQPLASFPEIYTAYESDQLFPLFTNRILPRSRGEYQEYLEWLSVPVSEQDPVAILARSGGRKVTDSLEVFPRPERSPAGEYQAHFLVHGLSHMPETSLDRAVRLTPGETLLVMRDIQNPRDPGAVALRTSETVERDIHLVGYVPRYLRGDFLKLIEMGSTPRIVVGRVNASPAPVQFRVLCQAIAEWPTGFEPFSGPEYRPLVPEFDSTLAGLNGD